MKRAQLSMRLFAIPLGLAALVGLSGCATGCGGFLTCAGPGFNGGFGPRQFDIAYGPARHYGGFNNHDDRGDHHNAGDRGHDAGDHHHDLDIPHHDDFANHGAGDRHLDFDRSPSHDSAPDRSADGGHATIAAAPEPSGGGKK